MFTQPTDLSDTELRDSLRVGWGFEPDSLGYAPVGFGSHHWIAEADDDTRMFVTVHDLAEKRRSRAEKSGSAHSGWPAIAPR